MEFIGILLGYNKDSIRGLSGARRAGPANPRQISLISNIIPLNPIRPIIMIARVEQVIYVDTIKCSITQYDNSYIVY